MGSSRDTGLRRSARGSLFRGQHFLMMTLASRMRLSISRQSITSCALSYSTWIPLASASALRPDPDKNNFIIQSPVHCRTAPAYRPWAAIYPPSPPRGILQGYIFLKAYTKCYKMSHVSTLAVGAFRIFGVKREEIMQKSLKIGNNFLLFPESRYRRSIYAFR